MFNSLSGAVTIPSYRIAFFFSIAIESFDLHPKKRAYRLATTDYSDCFDPDAVGGDADVDVSRTCSYRKLCLNADPTLPRRSPRQKKPLLVSPDFLISYCEAQKWNTMFQLHDRDVRAKWTVIELVLVLSFTIRIWAGARVLANEVGNWRLALEGDVEGFTKWNWLHISMTCKSYPNYDRTTRWAFKSIVKDDRWRCHGRLLDKDKNQS